MDQTLLDAAGQPTLRYTVGGAEPAAGPPVLLVHGFGSNFDWNWARTGWVGALRAAGRRFIGVDLPGHGTSPRPHRAGRYTPGVLAALLAQLLDTLGEPVADAVGYSMGSRLLWQLAVDFPGLVRRGVLGGFGPVNAFADTDLDRLEHRADTGRFAEVFAATAALPGADVAALAACARGQASQPYSPDPAPVGVPLLFVAGEHDEFTEGIESLAAGLAGAEVLRLAGRDHRSAVSAQLFKKAATEFLSAP